MSERNEWFWLMLSIEYARIVLCISRDRHYNDLQVISITVRERIHCLAGETVDHYLIFKSWNIYTTRMCWLHTAQIWQRYNIYLFIFYCFCILLLLLFQRCTYGGLKRPRPLLWNVRKFFKFAFTQQCQGEEFKLNLNCFIPVILIFYNYVGILFHFILLIL
jgi:hypothetical protein